MWKWSGDDLARPVALYSRCAVCERRRDDLYYDALHTFPLETHLPRGLYTRGWDNLWIYIVSLDDFLQRRPLNEPDTPSR